MTRKIRYKRLIVLFVFVLVFSFFVYKLFSLRITNIYISGNRYLSDQDIIEISSLKNYPRAVFSLSNSIESSIKKSQYVNDVKVKKKGFTRIYIDVSENRPLFFDQIGGKTVLMDGSTVNDLFNVPILVNSVSSDVYSEFLSKLSLIDMLVYDNISEIQYVPNDVDNELFLFFMNDGNYIYVNLDRFESVNRYFDMVINFNNHKGILYLDSGEYFKILDN